MLVEYTKKQQKQMWYFHNGKQLQRVLYILRFFYKNLQITNYIHNSTSKYTSSSSESKIIRISESCKVHKWNYRAVDCTKQTSYKWENLRRLFFLGKYFFLREFIISWISYYYIFLSLKLSQNFYDFIFLVFTENSILLT